MRAKKKKQIHVHVKYSVNVVHISLLDQRDKYSY